MIEFLRHLLCRKLHVVVVRFTFDEHTEAFVRSVNDALPILLVHNRIAKLLLFFLCVCRIRVIDISPEVFRWRNAVVNPTGDLMKFLTSVPGSLTICGTI